MTHKKYWKWFLDPCENLITDSGRFQLMQVDEISQMPIKDKNVFNINPPKTTGQLMTRDEAKEPVVNTALTFFDKLKIKFPAIKNLIVGAADLFTAGGASKIEKSIDAILTDDEENINVISNNQGSNSMLDTLKNFLTGMITRWILKIGGGMLLTAGITDGKAEEIVGAIVAIICGLVISLFQQKKALETDLKTIQK